MADSKFAVPSGGAVAIRDSTKSFDLFSVSDSAISGALFLDQDDMASDSAVSVCSQQSIKKYVDDQIGTKDTFLELTDTPSGYTTNGALYVANNTGTSIDESTVIMTEAANTFNITKGTSSLDVAAGAALDVDKNLTANGDFGTVLAGYGQENTVTLYENLTVSDGYGVTFASEDTANTLTLDEANFEVEGEGTSAQLLKLVNANNAAATLTIEGTSGVVNQDVTSDASPTFGGISVTGAQTVKQTNVSDANYNPSALTSDYIIAWTTLTAARTCIISTEDEDVGTATQPRVMEIVDESGNCSPTNTITITLESGGTINGAASLVLNSAYASVTLRINGTNAFIR